MQLNLKKSQEGRGAGTQVRFQVDVQVRSPNAEIAMEMWMGYGAVAAVIPAGDVTILWSPRELKKSSAFSVSFSPAEVLGRSGKACEL